MRTRKEAVNFIHDQFEDDLSDKIEKHGKMHYGKAELRELLDYIYEEKPKHKDEELVVDGWVK